MSQSELFGGYLFFFCLGFLVSRVVSHLIEREKERKP